MIKYGEKKKQKTMKEEKRIRKKKINKMKERRNKEWAQRKMYE